MILRLILTLAVFWASECSVLSTESSAGSWELVGIVSATDDQEFFEKQVRPLLLQRCVECHGPEQQAGDLRVDSREALLLGGQSGPALVLNSPDKSLLVHAIERSAELAMPPDDPLSADEIASLKAWIASGASWPEQTVPTLSVIEEFSAQHWAFQPITRPTVPVLANDRNESRFAIDRFVDAKLEQVGLTRSPEADRRTLIRRVSFVVTGLPPSAAEVDHFVQDNAPDAYERLIDSYLASPRFGEHWARLWLDVARYSDTKGYVYGREERFWTHAWTYRDWVIQSFNQDRPYDQFVQLQLAADQLSDDSQDLAAMGFLTLGRRFLGVKPDIVDDRIDVVSRGLLGLTVSCARCHDHKYDAIPTRDYYSLYGVFASSMDVERSLEVETNLPAEYLTELHQRERNYREQHAQRRAEAAARARERLADYLFAQLELEKYPDELFGQLFKKTDLLPSVVHRWADYLRRSQRSGDPLFVAWHRLLALTDDEFPQQAESICLELQAAPPTQVHPVISEALANHPPQNRRDVVQLYVSILQRELNRLTVAADSAIELTATATATTATATTATETTAVEVSAATGNERHETDAGRLTQAANPFFQLLFSDTSPCTVPDEPIVEIEYFLDFESCETLWKLQSEIERWVIQAEVVDRRARVLMDRVPPVEPQVFRRGSPLRKGEFVPRQFLQLLSGPDRVPFANGSGRAELALEITRADNPLTARVIANRIWGAVFGQPLVSTTSDFGLRAEPPSHPELLDWLAVELRENGWSLKGLIRTLVLSETFRQSSIGPQDETVLNSARVLDPENRWLWKFRAQRLEIETLRDSLWATSSGLDLTAGGKPVALWQTPFLARRSVYGLIDRQFLPGVYRTFDFANPDIHTPTRSETTVAQQALFFLNHPFVLDRSRELGELAKSQADLETGVRFLFRQVLQRVPTELELLDAIQFLDEAVNEEAEPFGPWSQLAQTLFSLNEFMFIE